MAKSKRSRSSLSYKLIDRALAPRIHRYISAEEGKELSIDQGAGSTRERRTLVLDIDAMIEDLRHRHPEYKRKTMAAFRSQVLRVCELPEIKQRMLNNYKKKEDDGHEESKQEVPQPSSESLVSSRFSSDATITEAPTTMTASSGDVEIASNGVGGINPTSNSSSSTGSKKRKNSTAILGIGDGGTSSSIIADVVRSGQQQQKNTRRKTSSFSISSTYNYTTRKKKKKRNNPKVGAFAAAAAARGDNEESGSSSSWVPEITRPTVRYGDVGGIEAILQDLRELVEYPLIHPEIYQHLGVQPPRGVLLHGPPGCGKTLLANAIAGELGVPFLKIAATEIVSGISGDSEKKLRVFFKEAQRIAPCLIFLDEIDAIAPKRETAQREMSRRIVAQLLTCMDSLSTPAAFIKKEDDSALRRAGRFDREITIGSSSMPDAQSRSKILRVVCKENTTHPSTYLPTYLPTYCPSDDGMRLAGDFDFNRIAKLTHGFVGADLSALAKEAAVLAVNRIFSGLRGVDNSTTTVIKTAETKDLVTTTMKSITDARKNDLPLNEAGDIRQGELNKFSADSKRGEGQEDAVKPMETSPQLLSASSCTENNNIMQNGKQSVNNQNVVNSENISSSSLLSHREKASAWLARDRTPLTSEQLAPLSVTMDDFTQIRKRIFNNRTRIMYNISVGDESFVLITQAVKKGFATVPNVTWADVPSQTNYSNKIDINNQNARYIQKFTADKTVGALWKLREELRMAILEPIKYPEIFESVGLEAPCGVLLYGPPGCGKTLVAKAVASESGASFLSVKGPELLNKYVGASEKAVRQVFSRARASAPCVIFFDELDALCPKRGQGNEGSQDVEPNYINNVKDESNICMISGFLNIFVIAATNRPDIIDPAMMRPGRLDKLLYVPLPSPDARYSILKVATKKTPLAANVDLFEISRRAQNDIPSDYVHPFALSKNGVYSQNSCFGSLKQVIIFFCYFIEQLNGFSGADLTALVREATTNSLRRVSNRLQEISGKISAKRMKTTGIYVDKADFTEALKRVFPSVSEETDLKYKRLQLSLRSSRRRITK
eukprot:jgi/Bigna1/81923/fgenesh1_pg.85_\